ncbi:MAG: PAS domain-containing protein [Candidatus Sericytochromatia bacterium]
MSVFSSDLRTLLSVLLQTPLQPDAEQPVTEISEASLRQAENAPLFQALFESTVIGKCLLMTDGQLYAANGAMCTYLGYSAAEMARETLVSITHPEDRQLMTGHLQRLVDGSLESFQIEKRFLHKEGQILWALVYVTALFDARHQFQGAVAEIQDLTRQKAEEEAFLAEHQRLKLAEHLAQMGTFEIDLGTGRTTWSEEIFQMIGLTPETFDLNYEIGMLNIHQDDRERARQAIQTAIAQRQEFRVEFRVRHSSGEYREHLSHGRVLLDPEGKALKVIGYLLNVMPFRQRELQLQETNRRLEAQNQQLLRLANLVSDELTGPLAGIQVIAGHEADRGNTVGILPLLAQTVHGLDGLDAASGQIRAARRLGPERRRISLEPVCSRVLQMLEAEIRQARVGISVDFSVWSELEFIPGYLENLLFNLLSYVVDLSREHSLAEIRIRSEFEAEAQPLLSVRILHPLTAAPGQGEDQRLQLVKSLLAASGGSLSVSPDSGGGTCFRLWF